MKFQLKINTNKKINIIFWTSKENLSLSCIKDINLNNSNINRKDLSNLHKFTHKTLKFFPKKKKFATIVYYFLR